MRRARGRMPDALRRLAGLHGVQLSFVDAMGRRRRASAEAVLGVLRALGVPLASPDDARSALEEALRRRWARRLEPVAVAWDGGAVSAILRLPRDEARGRARGHLRLEGGGARTMAWDLRRAPRRSGPTLGGRTHAEVRLPLPRGLPAGYHRLELRVGREKHGCTVLAAPTKAYGPREGERRWGAFVPLYALASRRSWGAGDLEDLRALVAWLADLGGGAVATLPLLASFLDGPVETSPYSPASRVFWNDLYVALDGPPLECPDLDALTASSGFVRALEAARAESLVDYRAVARLKDEALRAVARCAARAGSGRVGPERDPREARELERYARFRASRGTGRSERADLAARHAAGQRLVAAQLEALRDRARASAVDLFLDLPLGAHAGGYDVARHPRAFATGASVGAPPDPVFTGGQDWGFPPPHPERIREDGYRHLRDVLGHHMRIASVLRIDHVMGLHRLFWIPRGVPASDGVFVRYRPEEMYAVLSIESHRHGCVVVGENLGTVPAYVNAAMRRHGIPGLYVAQYEFEGWRGDGLPTVPSTAVASVNTHDMPPFAGYWSGEDIADRERLGLTAPALARRERSRRARTRARLARALGLGRAAGSLPTAREVYPALLDHLAASPAWLLLINLEDLWGETRPQNVPGTGPDAPNWRRRFRVPFEEAMRRPDVMDALRRVARLRAAARRTR